MPCPPGCLPVHELMFPSASIVHKSSVLFAFAVLMTGLFAPSASAVPGLLSTMFVPSLSAPFTSVMLVPELSTPFPSTMPVLGSSALSVSAVPVLRFFALFASAVPVPGLFAPSVSAVPVP